jgi:hypothetical protein
MMKDLGGQSRASRPSSRKSPGAIAVMGCIEHLASHCPQLLSSGNWILAVGGARLGGDGGGPRSGAIASRQTGCIVKRETRTRLDHAGWQYMCPHWR